MKSEIRSASKMASERKEEWPKGTCDSQMQRLQKRKRKVFAFKIHTE